MSFFRKFLSFVLAFACLSLPISAQAASSDTEDYIQRMMQYYVYYQEEAAEEIDVLLDYLEEKDASQGAMWRGIMEDWSSINSTLPITPKMLPDGLPEDDSLCIVILGYDLNDDGTMKDELIDRLVAGLSSAMKYPNAYVAVTGGPTSDVKGVTEAGQMAAWLRKRGVEDSRLIVETKALSTVQNATRVMKILNRDYPQVTKLAMITSDYHIRQGCAFFAAANHSLAAAKGTTPLEIVGTGVNKTGRQWDDLHTQAWGICAITGVEYESAPATKPTLAD